MATGFFFDEWCLWHNPGQAVLVERPGGFLQPMAVAGHAESPETKRRLKSLMDVAGLTAALSVRSAPPAGREALERVHAPAYLDRLKAASDAGGGLAGPSAPFGRGSHEIAALSAGLAIGAVDAVLRGEVARAYALTRPPGHHALPDSGMGFCLLNNIAVALEAARAAHGALRVAVLDWDVHHGNGTEAVYYARGDTLTVSIHQENCFPPGSGAADRRGTGAGEGANLNIPLLPGMGHASYLDALDLLALPAIRAFGPDLIVVANGLDANGFDPLARMQAHSGTFRAMAERTVALAEAVCGGRIVATHEGGYSEAVVPFCGLAVIETFAGRRTAVEDPFLPLIETAQPAPDAVAFQRARLAAQAAAG